MTIQQIDKMWSLSKRRIWQHISLTFLLVLSSCAPAAHCFPDQGKWDFIMNRNVQSVTVPKSLFAGSEIYVTITCDSKPTNTNISIAWMLIQSECWQDSFMTFENVVPRTSNDTNFVQQSEIIRECSNGGHIPLPEYRSSIKSSAGLANGPMDVKSRAKRANDLLLADEIHPHILNRKAIGASNPVYTIQADGVYLFALIIRATSNKDYNASVHIEMRGTYGFLSAVDWPLLPFYGVMCLIYVVFGVIWLMVSFMQWRDLLRIQFWIGGVILLGMLEKAMFYAEYQSINSTGVSVRGAVLLAEWVSCAKRTLARMLVIIVSLGFGIVKPRLGPMLHRVVGTGGLYFVLAGVESYLRVMNIKSDPNNQILVASIPLAVLDSAICWWIFTSLVQTTRTLRLRRNMVKLTLYRHFTNTLIFAVLASVVFMLFSIKTHRLAKCLTDWKDLWEDEAFWHILFSLLLLVIMILWRPTNNNQRYAFTPLLDSPEDEDDDDEEDQFVADVYGVKMRGSRNTNSPKFNNHKATTTDEDDLRWVEENIPTAIADATLPILDSDEEIINTRFEVSKMQ
ncbi:transmembrane protein 87A [Sitodiplosis mosellana]|uniref:transmembrane protein 87A n=1 Tax=Sitodiplosis mosellana TaxID=263140 RepID=UPI002443F3FD|nr:transmembrane protein 87A [Sitodiplosis mosellana]XP_055320345.1 transmembrane protein 87A [Sitodiplosis mosellana]